MDRKREHTAEHDGSENMSMKGAAGHLERDHAWKGAKQLQVGDETPPQEADRDATEGLPHPHERKDSPGV